VIYQYFELRYAPALGLLFFALAGLTIGRNGQKVSGTSEVLFCAGAGFLGFATFRLVLFSAFRDNLLRYICWEEFTELLFVTGVGAVLWTFRAGLLKNGAAKVTPS